MKNKFILKHIPQSEVSDDLFEAAVKIENSGGDGYTTEQMNELLRSSGRNDNFFCFLDGELAGYITYNPNSNRRNGSVFMINLMVDPKFRRMGAGQHLIASAVDFYLNKGISKPMSTSVDKDNFPAIKLYQKCGFEIREPVCELDEDDEQYIMDNSLEHIKSTIEQNIKNAQQKDKNNE